ncbi:hydroxyacid dehydrogenase [bacterium]|nr:hydroxyacid dehydrogenase [bacterium]
MTKVLLIDKVDKVAKEMLEKAGFEVDKFDGLSEEERLNIIGNYEAVVIRSTTKLMKNYIDKANNMKLIVRGGEGTDNIDKPYAAEKNIIVENTPGQNSHAVAELALGHMFGLARHLQCAQLSIKAGKWEKKKFKGTELKGKTVGIIGGGKIGKDLVTMCKAIGMNVLVYDPFLKQDEYPFKLVDLDNLLENSDYVSMHVPIMDATKDLINKEKLGKMKKNAYLINCARGGVVNEADLAKALEEGIIAGAAFDVYTKEPFDDTNPLYNAPNIHFTPHLGASTAEAQINCAVAAAEQIIAYFKENKVLNRVN